MSTIRVLALLGLVTLLLAGCIADAILRDPVSGQTVNCTVMGRYQGGPAFGRSAAIGAGMADGVTSAIQERSCINRYMGAGFQCIQGICVRR